MKLKKVKFRRLIFVYIFMIFFIFNFVSCKSNDQIIKTYSVNPTSSEIDEIFKFKDFDKIMRYYIFFQNSDDSIFINKLNMMMLEYLKESLIKNLNENTTIWEITKFLNNYSLFYFFVINKNQKDYKDLKDQLIEDSLSYLIDRLNKIENYYLFNSYLNYLMKIFPYFKDELIVLKEKKFNDNQFISSYEDVYKNTAMIISDRGVKIENGQSIPDISIGTGFFIDSDKIITNYHVVNTEGKRYILSVKVNSMAFPASIMLFDEIMDLAILEIKFKNEDFKYFKLADSLKIGDEIVASGNPYGLSFSNTKGIVSNLDRQFLQIGKVIQVDTPLNPGNSGGPAFKTNFELVGIAFASILNSQNLNFILPLTFFLDVLSNLYLNTEVQRSWLGFYFYDNNLLYQVKGNLNYSLMSKIPINNFQDFKFYYSENIDIKTKDYYFLIQDYISSLPVSSFVPIIYKDKTIFLITGRRPKYPMHFSVTNDDLNNCLTIIFDSKLIKDGEFYKIEKLFNPEISLFYGIYQGDLIKILSYYINSQKKIMTIFLTIKHPRFGGVSQQIAITISFSQPGFF